MEGSGSKTKNETQFPENAIINDLMERDVKADAKKTILNGMNELNVLFRFAESQMGKSCELESCTKGVVECIKHIQTTGQISAKQVDFVLARMTCLCVRYENQMKEIKRKIGTRLAALVDDVKKSTNKKEDENENENENENEKDAKEIIPITKSTSDISKGMQICSEMMSSTGTVISGGHMSSHEGTVASEKNEPNQKVEKCGGGRWMVENEECDGNGMTEEEDKVTDVIRRIHLRCAAIGVTQLIPALDKLEPFVVGIVNSRVDPDFRASMLRGYLKSPQMHKNLCCACDPCKDCLMLMCNHASDWVVSTRLSEQEIKMMANGCDSIGVDAHNCEPDPKTEKAAYWYGPESARCNTCEHTLNDFIERFGCDHDTPMRIQVLAF